MVCTVKKCSSQDFLHSIDNQERLISLDWKRIHVIQEPSVRNMKEKQMIRDIFRHVRTFAEKNSMSNSLIENRPSYFCSFQ